MSLPVYGSHRAECRISHSPLPLPRDTHTTPIFMRVILLLCLLAACTTTPATNATTTTMRIAPMPWTIHDTTRPQPVVVTPAPVSATMAAPPSDAVVLFGGSDLSQWEMEDGSPAKWAVR